MAILPPVPRPSAPVALPETTSNRAAQPAAAPAPKAAVQSPAQTDRNAPDTDERGRTAQRRDKGKGKGKARLQGPTAPKSNNIGVHVGPVRPRQPAASPASAQAPAAAQPAVAKTPIASDIKRENGELTFVLTIPATTPGQPDQRYKISVLGGEAADLASLNSGELAQHLSQAIALVQGNLETRDFQSITFEGRLGQDALAKAVVQTKTGQKVLGGEAGDRVAGTDRLFSDELEELLKRLQRTLIVRTSRIRATPLEDLPVPAAPPSTPVTPSFVGSDVGTSQAAAHAKANPEAESELLYGLPRRQHRNPAPKATSPSEANPEAESELLYGPPRPQRQSATPKIVEIDSDDEANDTFHDALEFPEDLGSDGNTKT